MRKKNRAHVVLSFVALAALTSQNMAASAYAAADGFGPRLGAPGPRPPGGGGPRPPGGGPRPSPTTTPAPTTTPPAPEPTTTPAPVASPTAAPRPPVNTDLANREGLNDGIPAGSQEGRERGNRDGQDSGKEDGYREEFNRCQRDARQQAYDAGYTDGYRVGGNDGNNDGLTRGSVDGQARGHIDGTADGQARADRDSLRDATPLGQAKGIEEANQSDATARGYADGVIAGDQEAQQRALDVDYPRGRKAYRNEMENEAVQSNDEISQRTASSPSGVRISSTQQMKLMDRGDRDGRGHGVPNASPDYRYSRPARTYSTPEENSVYLASYRNGYNQGFKRDFESSYRAAYSEFYRRAGARGCEEARRRDYRGDYNNGFEQGRVKGYNQAYQLAYDQNFRNAFNSVFPQASQAAYQDTYPRTYDRHFAEARAAAYSARVGELYNAAHERGRQEKFAQVYPQYAEQQFSRGRADEAQDFVDRPVRLLMVEATETNANGVFEPGEALRVHVKLRNFAAGALQGSDIKLKIQALDESSAVITQGEATLVKNLRKKSLTDVREALEYRMNESVAERASRFRVTATYLGRNVGSQEIAVTTKFQVAVTFAEELSFKDGLATTVKVRLTNQSQKPTEAMLRVGFLANSEKLEIANPEQTVAGLSPGETKIVEFTVTAHTSEQVMRIPLAVSVNGTRRIGLLDQTQEVPIINDYRVTLNAAPLALQKAGVARLQYRVENTGSRLLYRFLQLKVSVKNTDHPENFVILGPNPQFLMPLERGEATHFVVPVLVQADNMGGTLELTLMEEGKTVVIHEADFKKTLN